MIGTHPIFHTKSHTHTHTHRERERERERREGVQAHAHDFTKAVRKVSKKETV